MTIQVRVMTKKKVFSEGKEIQVHYFLAQRTWKIILQNKASNYYACQILHEDFGDSHIHFIENTDFPMASTVITKLFKSFVMIEVF